jgi:hypothetical protein
MPDIVKIGPQVNVENPRLPLDYCFSHALDGAMCCAFGPISIRPRLEVSLEYRPEDELERPEFYNFQRPHQALETARRWRSGEPVSPAHSAKRLWI